MKKSINIPWWAIVVVAAIIYFLGNINNYDEDLNEDNLAAVTAEMEYYKTKYNQEVISKQSFVTSNKKFTFLSDSLRAIIKNFKKPILVIRETTTTRIDSVPVPYLVHIPMKFERRFSAGDEFFSVGGISTNTGLTLDSISFINPQDIVFGEKKGGIFTVDITDLSPYATTTKVKSYTYQRKKRWHEKWYITIPASLVVGGLVLSR